MRIRQLPYISLLFFVYFLSAQISFSFADVKIRLLTDINPDLVIFTASSGQYEITDGNGQIIYIPKNESFILAKNLKRIIIKPRNREGFICDTVYIKAQKDNNYFSIRTNVTGPLKKSYSGNLKCYSDMEKLIIINTCDMEKYLEGVVKAEGGGGRNAEYFKTQAIIARTYTCRYFNKHLLDGYNLCDDTHCQVYDGLINDSVIVKSVHATSGLVITTPDSMLIISAFHSNCGGETSPSEYAWVTVQPYLKRVVDKYCLNSPHAAWEKKIMLKEWTGMLSLNGYSGDVNDPAIFKFDQRERVAGYSIGSFSVPFRLIRTMLDLKSAFFSVKVNGDSLVLNGRGYGHGVGLCQEGAINMALKGFTYQQIIKFYYLNVLIMDLKDVNFKSNNPDNVSF
jgi:stage II sporulation protein D